MENCVIDFYVNKLGIDDANNTVRNLLYNLEELPIVPKKGFPKGGITVRDSRECSDIEEMNYLYVWSCINEGAYDENTAVAQIGNYDFRQFCRNWNPEEVARLVQAKENGNIARSFSPSKNEKLIAAYFIRDDLVLKNQEALLGRMKRLMNYRTAKFVRKLYEAYDRKVGDHFFEHHALAIANYEKIKVIEDWEVRLIANVNSDSDGSRSDSDNSF